MSRTKSFSRLRAVLATVGLATAGLLAASTQAPTAQAQGAPSRTLERAIKLYDSDDFISATIELKKVLNGDANDDAVNKQRAEFFMGKAFFRMEFYAASLSYFERIVKAGPTHHSYAPTLKWLASLSRVLPETSGILDLIGKYDPALLNDDSLKNSRDHLYYLLGRHYYRQAGDGDFEKALELFNQVSRDNEFFIKAKFFAGVTHVRKLEGKPAVDAFKEILVLGEEKPKQYSKLELEQYTDLARLQMARVFYSTQQFDTSIKYYEKLEQNSPDWAKALFESSWAYFRKSISSKSLGNIHSLNAPYFEEDFFPESLLLKAVIYFQYCQYDRAQESIGEYNEKFRPLVENLATILAKTEDDAEFYEYIKTVMAKKAGLDSMTQRIVLSVLADRTLRKTFQWVERLDVELEKLNKSDKAWQSTQVAGEVLQQLTLQQSEAQTKAGGVARDRISRLQKELQALSRDGLRIEAEILEGQANRVSAEALGSQVKKGSKEEPIIVDDEHFEWRFNGEYWKDELGYYRYKIRSECAAQ